MTSAPTYEEDLFSDSALTSPYGRYHDLRELGAVVRLSRHDVYALPRYKDVRAALADNRVFSSASGVGLNEIVNTVLQGTMLASDPPLHGHLRQVVSHRLTPRAIRSHKETIDEEADRLVADLVRRGTFEAVTDLAYAMPLRVIPDFLGWPDDSRDKLRSWAYEALQGFGPLDNQRTRSGLPIAQEMGEYTAALARERNLLPGSLGAELLAAADLQQISHDQCPTLLLDYLGPSIDTTASTIANAVALFAAHPDQWELLRSDPELVPRAFNEIVRFETPLRAFTRLVTQGVEIDGVAMRAGDRVLMMFGSANRDERKWDRPAEFEIRRDAADHLGFGYGIHSCAGQGIARLETHAVLSALARRVSRFEISGPPVHAVNNTLRAYDKLPLTVTT